MPEISQGLRRLVRLFDEQSVPYMLIGGYALAAYGIVRATIDVDIAIAADFQKTVELQRRLRKAGFSLPSTAYEEAPMFFVSYPEADFEAEIWTKPDGVFFDTQLLKRRLKFSLYGFDMFAIGPEDFIVNKLARTDRGAQDEMDVISVLTSRREKIDYKYLRSRAKRAGVLEVLEALREKSRSAPL